MVCSVNSLKSPPRRGSKEYTQHTYFMIKQIIKHLFCRAIGRISLRLKKRVRISYGKRDSGVRVSEVLLCL